MRNIQHGWIAGMVCLVAGMQAVRCDAYWNAERAALVGNWDTASQWASDQNDMTEPTAASDGNAVVGNRATMLYGQSLPGTNPVAEVTIDSAGNSCFVLCVAFGDGVNATTGTINFTDSGALTSDSWQQYGLADVCRATVYHTGTGANQTDDGFISLAAAAGSFVTYNLSNANASVTVSTTGTDDDLLVGTAGTGTFNHYSGTVTVSEDVRIGDSAGAVGEYNIESGSLEAGAKSAASARLVVGVDGTGTVNQTGGTVDLGQNTLGRLYVGGEEGGTTGVGIYDLSGGTCDVFGLTLIGDGGHGTVDQSAGLMKMVSGAQGWHIHIGRAGTGIYNLTGGTLQIVEAPSIVSLFVGSGGSGTLNIGDASGVGTLTSSGAGQPIDLKVRAADSSSGTLRGWSDNGVNAFELDGTLYNSGRIIADSYGVAGRSLNLSVMSSNSTVAGVSDNTTSNGWFAVNKGKLILPGVAVSAATTYNWGERQADSTIDAVNSARIKFNNFSGAGGDLDGELLATDRSDVPAGPVSLISVHDFSLSGDASSTDFNLTIRYDDAAAGSGEAELKLFHYTGGSWVDTVATLDTGNKWITASNLTAFSEFGVGFYQSIGSTFIVR